MGVFESKRSRWGLVLYLAWIVAWTTFANQTFDTQCPQNSGTSDIFACTYAGFDPVWGANEWTTYWLGLLAPPFMFLIFDVAKTWIENGK